MGLVSFLHRLVTGASEEELLVLMTPPPPPEPWTKAVSRDYLRDRVQLDGEEVYARVMAERKELLAVEEEGRREMRAEALDVLYPRLDLGFLAWTTRRVEGVFPRFAVFGLDDPVCQIMTFSRPFVNTEFFREHSSDLVVRLAQYFDFNSCVPASPLETRFGGVIPPPVREVIKREKETDHFEVLGIIAEVQRWEVTVPAGDPLLVGLVEDQAWLLASFNTTSTEDYVVGMFTK